MLAGQAAAFASAPGAAARKERRYLEELGATLARAQARSTALACKGARADGRCDGDDDEDEVRRLESITRGDNGTGLREGVDDQPMTPEVGEGEDEVEATGEVPLAALEAAGGRAGGCAGE